MRKLYKISLIRYGPGYGEQNQPGWANIVTEPHPGGLTWARGNIPTPRGTISIEWKTGDVFSFEVDIPARATIVLPLLKDGQVKVTDREENNPKRHERLADSSGRATVILHEPGVYRIIAN